jgi:hypothetical protein
LFGGHSFAETVGADAFDVAGLERAFHSRAPLCALRRFGLVVTVLARSAC